MKRKLVHVYFNTKYEDICRIDIIVRVGSSYESKDELGIAHLLEHMIVDSWKYDINYWNNKGIFFNAVTNICNTNYYIVGSAKYLNDMLLFVCDIMLRPIFTQDLLDRSKNAVIEELKQFMNNPNWELNNMLYNNISSVPGISEACNWSTKIKLLSSFTLDDVRRFHKKYFENEVIYLFMCKTNPINKFKNICKQTTKCYSKSQMMSLKLPINKNAILNNKNISSNTSVLCFTSILPHNTEFLIYIDIISEMLTGNVSSILNKKLRNELGLVYSIYITYERIHNIFLSMINYNTTHNTEHINEIIIKLLMNISTMDNMDKLFEGARERVILRLSKSYSLDFLSNFYSRQYVFNDTVISHDNIVEKLRKVGLNDISNIISNIFKKNNLVSVIQRVT